MEAGDGRQEAGQTSSVTLSLWERVGVRDCRPISKIPFISHKAFLILPASGLLPPVSCLHPVSSFIQRVEIGGGHAHHFFNCRDAAQYLGESIHAQRAHAFL